ncbi:MAG: hypothetical protein QM604_03910 [Microbacterium sp.]
MTETRQVAEQAHRDRQQLNARHLRESVALSHPRTLAGSTPSRVIAHAAKYRKQAERDRRDLARIVALSLPGAVHFVRDRAAQAESARIAAEGKKAAAQARAAKLDPFASPSTNSRRPRPERDFGPSL